MDLWSGANPIQEILFLIKDTINSKFLEGAFPTIKIKQLVII